MKSSCVCSLVGILVLIGACRSGKPEIDKSVLVKTDTVRNYQDELAITYPGKVKAASDVNLAFRIAGPIRSMPVETGAFVRKGQLVAEIDPRDYEIQLSATEAEYKRIKAEADRIVELYRRKSVPKNDYDKAVYGLQQITAKYDAHRNALKDTRLLAPFDGYIQKKYFDSHETVGAGMPVIAMIDGGYFEVEIDIPSSDYIRQRYFKSFSCTFDVFPGKTFPLELIEISKKANLNQLYRVRLRLHPEKEVDIAAGMSVNVTIDYTPDEETLTIVPLTAVFEETEGAAVWIYDPVSQTIAERKIEPRKFLKTGDVVINAGLNAGEIVVTAGVHRLKNGMKVQLLQPMARTNIGGVL